MNKEITPEFWGYPDDELLTDYEMHECIESKLDEMFGSDCLPKQITVAGFVKKEVQRSERWAADALENMLENLDVNYGSHEESTPATEKMKWAAEFFANTVLDEYVPWQCEQVCEETVNVKAWVTEHCPEWLPDVVFAEDQQ